jgi:hypothetical protein
MQAQPVCGWWVFPARWTVLRDVKQDRPSYELHSVINDHVMPGPTIQRTSGDAGLLQHIICYHFGSCPGLTSAGGIHVDSLDMPLRVGRTQQQS